jgi:hypothetical protein
VGGGIETARAKGFKHVVLYAHGGLNDREAGLARARNMGPWFEVNGIYPIFVVWQTGFFETAKNVIAGFAQELAGPEKPPATGGLLEILRDRLDRSFEWSARQLGVKAIWEDMKMRADLASLKEGATGLAARTMLANLKDTKLHVIGHSAGAILLGNFIAALARSEAKVASCELWAPACTVDFCPQDIRSRPQGRQAGCRTHCHRGVVRREREAALHGAGPLLEIASLSGVARARARSQDASARHGDGDARPRGHCEGLECLRRQGLDRPQALEHRCQERVVPDPGCRAGRAHAGLSILRDPKVRHFAGVNSMAQPGLCIRRATTRGQARWDGQIIQMDTRRLLLIARPVQSNSMV